MQRTPIEALKLALCCGKQDTHCQGWQKHRG